jgi:dTDP-4-dehydrorhamnose reductase
MEYNILNNALITGGSGMIGSNINFGYKPSSLEMDITDTKSIETYINSITNVSCIIHLAAINLRESETNCKKAIDVNITGTTKMLNAAMRRNIPFVLLSSGAVFSSMNANIAFDENFKTCPNSLYGISKASSEEIALLYDKTIVIRTGWLFGGNQKNHYKFVESAINNFLICKEVKASNNFFGSPTYVIDLIEQMNFLLINSKYGVHHVVNDEFANGYEIASEIAEILGINKNLILSVKSEEIPNSGPKRSSTEILETIYPFNKLRSWKTSLAEYIKKYCENSFTVLEKQNPIKKWNDRKICRLCDSKNLKPFLKLHPTPPANHFVSEPCIQELIPLETGICDNCSHIQLLQIIEPDFLYSNYFYVSSASVSMINHLKNSVIEFTNFLNISKTEDYILEIGANDGVCIKHLINNGFKNVVGIDPAANINERHDLPIVCDFFGSNILDKFKSDYKPFKLIYGFHCCAHIENIQDVFNTVYNLLDDHGSFIMEVGYFYEVFKNNLFDTIYHEHIDYHTCLAIQKFGLKNNLLLFKVCENNIQGGSIQFFFCKNNNTNVHIDQSVYDAIDKEYSFGLHNYNKLSLWKNKITLCGNDINYLLNSLITYGKRIAGYGASAKSTTFLYEYRLNNKLIDYIVDDSIFKQDFYSPGLHIPIKSSNYLSIQKVDYIIILSWNFTADIIEKLESYRNNGLRIIIPFPEIKII